MTGYKYNGGGFNNAIYKLNSLKLIEKSSLGRIQLAGNVNGLTSFLADDETPHRLEDWINKLGMCERTIYQILLQHPEIDHSKEDLADLSGYTAGGGGFNNAIYRLNTLGLIQKQGSRLKLNPEIVGI